MSVTLIDMSQEPAIIIESAAHTKNDDGNCVFMNSMLYHRFSELAVCDIILQYLGLREPRYEHGTILFREATTFQQIVHIDGMRMIMWQRSLAVYQFKFEDVEGGKRDKIGVKPVTDDRLEFKGRLGVWIPSRTQVRRLWRVAHEYRNDVKSHLSKLDESTWEDRFETDGLHLKGSILTQTRVWEDEMRGSHYTSGLFKRMYEYAQRLKSQFQDRNSFLAYKASKNRIVYTKDPATEVSGLSFA